MKKYTVLFLLVMIILHLHSQDVNETEMITDRPDQTESASIVPARHLQLETGFVFQGDESNGLRQREFAAMTTLLRYGVNEFFELRLGSAFLNVNNTIDGNDATISGLAPLFAGIKFKMLHEDGLLPEMAFLISTEIPSTGKKEFSPEYVAADMRFVFEYTLTERLGLGVNLGGRWNGSEPQPAGLYSLVFGYATSRNLGVFIESYGFLPQEQKPDHRLDAGFTYSLKNNLQIDASAGTGLSEISPDYFINAGISWRIPN